jgi:hypothetical protein
MSVGFLITELAKFLGVDKVAVHTHRNSEWGVDIEGLSF